MANKNTGNIKIDSASFKTNLKSLSMIYLQLKYI